MTWRESVAMNLESKGKYLTDEQKWLVREVAEFFAIREGQPMSEAAGQAKALIEAKP